MARHVAMLVNGGRDIDITLIREISSRDGRAVDRTEISEAVNRRLGLQSYPNRNLEMTPENIAAVLEGMRAATSDAGGTAHGVFRNFPIEVAGKTGTAEAGETPNAWFVGVAPYEEPEIAIAVIVENGGRGFHVAEVVRDILEVYFGINEDILEDRTAMGASGSRN